MEAVWDEYSGQYAVWLDGVIIGHGSTPEVAEAEAQREIEARNEKADENEKVE